jgi:hypothetical protein
VEATRSGEVEHVSQDAEAVIALLLADVFQLAGLGTVDPLETCQMCEKKFRRGGNMRRHTEVMHTPRPVPVPCTKKQFCTMSFPTVHEMVQHREHCNFICVSCGKSIKRGKRVAGHTKFCPGKE